MIIFQGEKKEIKAFIRPLSQLKSKFFIVKILFIMFYWVN